MTRDDDPIRALLEALDFSPDNVPLRCHLAELLRQEQRGDEALALLKDGVRRLPGNETLQLQLADAFRLQDNVSAALVIIEDLLKKAREPGPVLLMHARILLQQGELVQAERQYRRALKEDDELREAALEQRFAPEEEDAPDGEGFVEFPVGRIRMEAEASASLQDGLLLEEPDLSFADVGGMEAIKKEIRRKIIAPLENPELFAAYGKKAGGGILLYGPPGCGKTWLARATAGEVKASFLAIGIQDVLDMWLGESERKLHEIFTLARGNAPCVLFFDEVDALGASRGDLKGHAGRNTVNQFLAELDGAKEKNDGVLILAATNMPWSIDSAFRRPGRFDRVLFVPPPDAAAREAILKISCEGKPQEKLDLDKVVRKTDGFSGADLKALVERCVEDKLEIAIETGVPEPLRSKDLLRALRSVKPTTKEWFTTARNYVLYANEGGQFDELKSWLGIQ
ncbi:MAG: cell division protein [Planctomycetota bacterium]|nr:MAG: cell division protein [Planctomycetota bacterium]